MNACALLHLPSLTTMSQTGIVAPAGFSRIALRGPVRHEYTLAFAPWLSSIAPTRARPAGSASAAQIFAIGSSAGFSSACQSQLGRRIMPSESRN